MLRRGSFLARFVALSLLVILLLAFAQLVVQPLFGAYRNNYLRIADVKEQTRRYKALAAETPVLAERAEILRTEDGTGTNYLEGPSDALAAAQLQDLVSAAIDDAGGDITTKRILEAVDVENGPSLRKVGLVLQFTTDLEGLVTALDGLETMDPQMFVADLAIGLEGSADPRPRAGDADSSRPLDVRLNVFSYVRKQT